MNKLERLTGIVFILGRRGKIPAGEVDVHISSGNKDALAAIPADRCLPFKK